MISYGCGVFLLISPFVVGPGFDPVLASLAILAKLLRQLSPSCSRQPSPAPPSSLLAKHLSTEERRRLVASGEAASS